MEKKLLLSGEPEQYKAKDIMIFDEPERLKAALSKLGWKILQALSEKEMYPMEIAKTLQIHEQKVYYHMKKLLKAGITKIVREEKKKGAVAKYYRAAFPALGIELPFGYRTIKTIPFPRIDDGTRRFLRPFLKKDGTFDGKIVVGSPDPHGPFKARARDGHYASYLTFYLGRLVQLPEDFVIRLDVDMKAEKEEDNNLILVGGPGTNLVTQEINDFLPIGFNMMPSKHGFLLGGLVSKRTGNVYTGDTMGVVARIANPKDRDKTIIILAGNKAVGTKACVLALTQFGTETLKNFTVEEDFATVIQGFDLDGDGKVDSIEILE
jgi:DNA-binding transcriptional ArsR family regulator